MAKSHSADGELSAGSAAQEDPRQDAPGNAEVQSEADKLTEQGYLGVKVDDEPDESYTVAGSTDR